MPKSKRAAKAPKHHPRAAAKRSPSKKSAPSAEPEVLGGDAPRGLGENGPGGLDMLVSWLEGRDELTAIGYAACEVWGGKWAPDRELALLKLLKADGRFIIHSREGRNVIGLRPDAAATSGAQTTLDQVEGENAAAAATASVPPPTLGDLVKDANGRQPCIPWPHDVGSHVLLITDGHPPSKATIRNIHRSGNVETYDLTMQNGGTTDGVPAWRIGRDLELEGELQSLRDRLEMEKRHRVRSKTLADLYAAQELTEKELATSLKEHREQMAETAKSLADHARTDPGQKTIFDAGVPATDNATPRQARKNAKPSDAEDKLADEKPKAKGASKGAAAADGVDLGATELTVDELMASRFEQSTSSTGKPQQVKPVKVMGEDRVLVDVQDGKAVMVLVVPKKGWQALYAEQYGAPAELPHMRTSKLDAGGRWCGVPVKVGRTTCWLGSTMHAVLVRLPAEPEKPTGKEAAAGA